MSDAGYIEPIPALIQDLIDHMIQWHLIPENRKPNSCIINFFDEVFILELRLLRFYFKNVDV